jgi:nitroimidazol reductase NimA-like FMN-containing flavoprotein (pyridoxamine 5'-phosphate oxidase superfamily)
MPEPTIVSRSHVRQLGARAHYERETVYQIIDASPICHVGFEIDGQPYVIPSLHARDQDTLLLHGAPDSRLVRHLCAGPPVCISFTLLDGWVLGTAACSHSMNYRSVVLFGTGRAVTLVEQKLRALELLTEHMMPGRWREVRPPNERQVALEPTAADYTQQPPSPPRSVRTFIQADLEWRE